MIKNFKMIFILFWDKYQVKENFIYVNMKRLVNWKEEKDLVWEF